MENRIDIKTLIICLLLELVVLHVLYSSVYDYSDIKGVVDAFGFGGTLVGILVGVIAIIYAFYQGTAQQRTNETLILEISKLGTVKEEIAITSDSLKLRLNELDSITEKITQIDQKVSDSNTHLNEISHKLADVGKNKAEPAASVGETMSSLELLKNYIDNRGQVYICMDAYVLKNVNYQCSLTEHAHKLFDKMKAFGPKIYAGGDASVYEQPLTAMLNLIVNLYESAGIISYEVKTVDDVQQIKWLIVDSQLTAIGELKKTLLASADEDHKQLMEELLVT